MYFIYPRNVSRLVDWKRDVVVRVKITCAETYGRQSTWTCDSTRGQGEMIKTNYICCFFICVLGSVIDFLGEPFNPQSLNILDAVNSDTGDTLNSLLLSVLWYYLPMVRDGEFVNLSDIIRNVGSDENVMNTISLENVQNFTYTERSSVVSFVPSPKLLTYREIRLSYVIKSPCCVLAFSSATKIWTIFKARWLQVFYVKNHP